MTRALLALLLLALGVLLWRAVTRDRRDYAKFKRLRSTTLRRKAFRRWAIESWLVLGGLSALLLLGAWEFVAPALEGARAWGPVSGIPYDTPLAWGIVVGAFAAFVAIGVVPVLLLRSRVDEVPAVGDIRALLPRERGELPYGAALAITAGIVEELLFRLALPAVLFGITGSAPVAFLAATVVFGLLHVYQGPQGMALSLVLGLVFTALYVLAGTILVPIVLHALVDLRSLVLIPVVLGTAGRREPGRVPGREPGTASPAAASPTRSVPRPPDPPDSPEPPLPREPPAPPAPPASAR